MPEEPESNAPTTPTNDILPVMPQPSVAPAVTPTPSPYAAYTLASEPVQATSVPEAAQPNASVSATPAAPEAATPHTVMPIKRRRLLGKRPLLIGGVALVVAVLLGGGFVFGFYLPNTPGGVFDASLRNTAAGIDQLLDYGKLQDLVQYKSAAYDGTFSLKSPSGSMDGTLSGSSDRDANADLTAVADILGQKGTVNIKSVHAGGNENPDIYLQVTGIKPLLAQAGLEDLDNVDGQWISIDHTLIDTYAARLKASNTTTKTGVVTPPTYADLDDAARKVQAVNKQYLFTTDSSKAVLQQKLFVGSERVDGRPQNHYTVGYNKAHLQAYVAAVKTALDSSKLNDWSVKMNGKNLSSVMDFDNLKKAIDTATSGYSFDLWADTGSKLVSKLVFKDPSDSNTLFTLTQGYHGGTSYPFTLAIAGKGDSGEAEDGTLGLTLDTAAHKLTLIFKLTDNASDGQTKIDMTIHAAPSNAPVKVVAPASAKSLNEIFQSLGLGDPSTLLPTGGGAATDSLAPFVLQQ